jgi:hypothetical protein
MLGFFVVVTVLASFVQPAEIISQHDYFVKFEEGEPHSPFQWFIRSFKFLVDNYAFYEERIHYISYDGKHGRDVAYATETLRNLGWNVSYEYVLVLKAGYANLYNGENGKSVCKVMKTNATHDDASNYRTVINLKQEKPYTLNGMHVDHPWCHGHYKEYCFWENNCNKMNWVIPVIKIDTRTTL